jgi:hypothetical protein
VGGDQLHQWLLPLKAFRETTWERGSTASPSDGAEKATWITDEFGEDMQRYVEQPHGMGRDAHR